jgi:hypothetical protein
VLEEVGAELANQGRGYYCTDYYKRPFLTTFPWRKGRLDDERLLPHKQEQTSTMSCHKSIAKAGVFSAES